MTRTYIQTVYTMLFSTPMWPGYKASPLHDGTMHEDYQKSKHCEQAFEVAGYQRGRVQPM